jgi:hypothetical protein
VRGSQEDRGEETKKERGRFHAADTTGGPSIVER